MVKTISASAMRDRLLTPVKASVASDDWMRVLSVPGHRELLGLIARHNPMSIGALAELAGRAQPNISRALTALVGAGLVSLFVSGRRSVPQITESGASRARALGLLEKVEASPSGPLEPASLFSVEFEANTDEASESDAIAGTLTSWMWLTSSKEQVPARSRGNLDALAKRVLENWWRLIYRRDAPFRLWEFLLEQQASTSYALLATVTGPRINLQARSATGRTLDLEHGSRQFTVAAFEEHLLEGLLRPLASRHRLEGRSARPLHALLRRIEDSREQPAERAFCRTAGALGLSPYDVADEQAVQIRDLIDLIADEDARLDFSSAVLADSLGEGQLWTSHELERFRERNAMPLLGKLRETYTANHDAPVRAFRWGYALARSAREWLGLAEDTPIGGVAGIAKLLGAGEDLSLSPDAPGTLRAFQSFEGEAPTFIVEDEGPRASAFTLARGIGDFLAFGSRASCVADLYTDRQAVGRAFAAEFMAPRNAVVEMIEYEDQPMARISDHFGVSVSVVHRQYENAV